MQIGLQSEVRSSGTASLTREAPGRRLLDDVMAFQHREVAALREQMGAMRRELTAMRRGGTGPSPVSQISHVQVSVCSTLSVCSKDFCCP